MPEEAELRGTYFVTVVGAVAGLAIALVVTRFVSGWLLYGVTSYDPPAILAAIVVIIVVSVLAAYVPARRAAQLDPMIALRYE